MNDSHMSMNTRLIGKESIIGSMPTTVKPNSISESFVLLSVDKKGKESQVSREVQLKDHALQADPYLKYKEQKQKRGPEETQSAL